MNIIPNRELLKQLWRNRFFDSLDLNFSSSTQFEVLSTGVEMSGSVADFSGVVLRDPITGVEIIGGVKIDTNTSDWREQGTLLEPSYDGIILHLVANNNTQLLRNGRAILSCQLTPKNWIVDYYSSIALSCAVRFEQLNSLKRNELLSQLLDMRIERKTQEILDILKSVNGDWYECCYIAFFRAMGTPGHYKAEFESIARSVNYSYISLHKNREILVIATLLNQAGYLDFRDDDLDVDQYSRDLQREVLASQSSDGVRPITIHWKPQHHRPTSAPASILVRAASILCAQPELFDLVTQLDDLDDLIQHLTVDVHEYWTTHYAPSRGEGGRYGGFGGERLKGLILNFVIPVLYARSILDSDERYAERAYRFYEAMETEHYSMLMKWNSKEWQLKTTFDSQAIIQLNDNYCRALNCISCPLAAKELLRVWRSKIG